MNIFPIFIIGVTAILRSSEQTKDVTIPLRERLALLKYQINEEIDKNNRKHDAGQKYQNDVSSLENMEYVDLKDQPITPINEDDERKKDGKFLLRPLKTSKDKPRTRPLPTLKKKTTKAIEKEPRNEKKDIVADDFSSSEEKTPKLIGIDKILGKAKKDGKIKLLRGDKFNPEQSVSGFDDPSHKNVFYRRVYDADLIKMCSKDNIIHCTELLTPILTGQKTNITYKRLLTYKDPEVLRLLELLNEDMTHMTKDDIYSTLYQISNLQIRLFMWDIPALKMLFNVIGRGSKRHSWKTIKGGLKRLLTSWHMDFTNVTNLMHQARIFRPPCIANNLEGSTQSSKTIRYTKKTSPKKG